MGRPAVGQGGKPCVPTRRLQGVANWAYGGGSGSEPAGQAAVDEEIDAGNVFGLVRCQE